MAAAVPLVAPSGRKVKWTTGDPGLPRGPLSVAPYVSPEFFEREREAIFRQAWLEVARAEEIPDPGDFLVVPMEVWNAEIIVVRGRDGRIRAFHNVCRHRGMKVSRCPGRPVGGDPELYLKGNTNVFMCPFHGWTYDLDGGLRAVLGEEYFDDFDRSKLGLVPVSCDEWRGFIFVNWQHQPRWTLREYLGGLGDQLDPYPFENFNHIATYSARCKANWKVVIDAFQEAYHAVFLHGRSIPDCAENPEYALPTSVRVYGSHRSLSVWANPKHVPTPAEALAWKYGLSFTPGELIDVPGINPDGDDNWWFDINVVFPSFFCDVGPGWYFTYNFRPVAVDQTYWVMKIYQLDARRPSERVAQEHTKCLLRDIVYEDLSTLEETQQALASGAVQDLVVSYDMEIAVRHQHHAVMQWVDGEVR